jgi:hypothetical protein
MTQNTKNLLMIGGVAVVGYLLYKNFGGKKSFANAEGRGMRGGLGLPRRTRCKDGLYATYNTNSEGRVTSTTFRDCKTGKDTGTSLGYITSW